MQNNKSQYLKKLHVKPCKIAHKTLNFSALNHVKAAAAKENLLLLNCVL